MEAIGKIIATEKQPSTINRRVYLLDSKGFEIKAF